MATSTCKKTKTFSKGSTFISNTFNVQGCDQPHECGIDEVFQCGYNYNWKPCTNKHIWTCLDCAESKRTTLCKELISVTKNVKIHFKACSHNSTENTTLRCGTKVECIDASGCNQDHTILCKVCKKEAHSLCKKVITLQPGKAYPALPCGQTHTIVDDEETESQSYFCGQSFTPTELNSCTVKEHKIYCDECQAKLLKGTGGLHRSFNNGPPITSTPKVVSSKSKLVDDENAISNQMLSNIAEIQKNVNKSLNDNNWAQKDDNNCAQAKHIFEVRTKKFLSAPARKFSQAHRACKYHLEYSKTPISREFGDNLLQELIHCYDNVEKMRQYCLEPLTETELLEGNYDDYLTHKWDLVSECRQLHDQYFNADKIQQELSHHKNVSIFHNPKDNNLPNWSKPVVPQPLSNFQVDENSEPNPFDIKFHHESKEKQPYFKLKEELALVTKFNASQPKEYMAFRANWNNFIQKMNKAKRSELDKFYALLSVLEGRAKDLIQTKYPRDGSYTEAINKLDQLFYQPANLLRDMMTTLNKTNKMVDTYDSLLQGVTKLWDAWADLNHAKLSNDQLKGLFFISASEKNLSKESWKFWLEVQNEPRNIVNPMACYDINSYMGAINKAMTNAEKMQNALGKPQWAEQDRVNKPKSTLYGSYNVSTPFQNQEAKATQKQARFKNGSCVFCKQNPHKYQLYCPKLKMMKPEEIWETMEQNGIRCSMCLGAGHQTIHCKATNDGILKPCMKKVGGKTCGKYHCGFLHRHTKPVSNLTINNTTNNDKSTAEAVQPQN